MDYGLKCEFDDCMQESLLLLNECINKYKESDVPFGAFFSKALRNKLITLTRKRDVRNKKIYVSESILLLINKDDPYGTLPDYNAFNGLDEMERLILDLHFIRQWSVKKIADEYLIKESHIYYIIKKIKAKVQSNLN